VTDAFWYEVTMARMRFLAGVALASALTLALPAEASATDGSLVGMVGDGFKDSYRLGLGMRAGGTLAGGLYVGGLGVYHAGTSQTYAGPVTTSVRVNVF